VPVPKVPVHQESTNIANMIENCRYFWNFWFQYQKATGDIDTYTEILKLGWLCLIHEMSNLKNFFIDLEYWTSLIGTVEKW